MQPLRTTGATAPHTRTEKNSRSPCCAQARKIPQPLPSWVSPEGRGLRWQLSKMPVTMAIPLCRHDLMSSGLPLPVATLTAQASHSSIPMTAPALLQLVRPPRLEWLDLSHPSPPAPAPSNFACCKDFSHTPSLARRGTPNLPPKSPQFHPRFHPQNTPWVGLFLGVRIGGELGPITAAG